MNFDDTPQEAEFRSLARKWVEANAPRELEAELSKSSLGRIRLQHHDMVEVGKAWQKKKAEGGWATGSMTARPGSRRSRRAAGPVCIGRQSTAGTAASASRTRSLTTARAC